ncbi:MAG: flagellum-specific ATP synthase FliI, partial [Oxalobacteraceae bacterium]
MDPHTARWKSFLNDCGNVLDFVEPMQVSGRVTRVAGLVMECVGLKLPVGSACSIPIANGTRIDAEVVGFEGERLFLMPHSDVEGVVPGTRVYPNEPSIPKPGSVDHPRRRPEDRARHLPVGWGLLGRVVDGAGRPLDGKGPLDTSEVGPLNA